jgi:hypothetical protein
VNAFEAHRVHEPTGVAGDQHPAGVQAGHRVPAALRQRLGPVTQARPAVEQRRDVGMLLESLEYQIRIEHRILVVEPADESDRGKSVAGAVDEPAAELRLPQRVSQGVGNGAFRNAIGREFPKLLQAKGVELRQPPLVERQILHEPFREVSPDAVTENRDLRADVRSWLVG